MMNRYLNRIFHLVSNINFKTKDLLSLNYKFYLILNIIYQTINNLIKKY